MKPSRQERKERNRKIRTLRLKLVFLYIFSFILSIAPLIILISLNHDKYFDTTPKTWKFTIGGILAIVLIVIKALDKLRFPNRMVAFGVGFTLVYLLQAMLNDILMLLAMAFLGELIDWAFIKPLIRRYKEEIEREKTGNVVADKVEEALQKYAMRINGRV